MRCKVKVKPLSVNSGEAKNKYKAAIKRKLPKRFNSESGKLSLSFDFYFSNEGCDYDGPIKYTQDAICEKYNLQDSSIYHGEQDKHLVKKGKEKIVFTLEAHSSYRLRSVYMPWMSYLLNVGLISIICMCMYKSA